MNTDFPSYLKDIIVKVMFMGNSTKPNPNPNNKLFTINYFTYLKGLL